jgi:hypothetical protein
VNSPGWSPAVAGEPGVRNALPGTVRDSILKIADIIVSDGRMESWKKRVCSIITHLTHFVEQTLEQSQKRELSNGSGEHSSNYGKLSNGYWELSSNTGKLGNGNVELSSNNGKLSSNSGELNSNSVELSSSSGAQSD